MPVTDVHRIIPFDIPEIVCQVVEQMAQNSKGKQKLRHQFLSLSLICKSFYEPSMDMLWRVMENIQPLLALIPANLETQPNQWSIVGSLREDACPTFHAHRHRVKEFIWSDTSRTTIEALSLIRLLCLPGGFLPMLHSMQIKVGEATATTEIAVIPALLSSLTCQHLSLNVMSDTGFAPRFSPLLPMLCDAGIPLVTVNLKCYIEGEHFDLSSWTSLTHLSLYIPAFNVTSSLFHAFTSTTSLKSLTMISTTAEEPDDAEDFGDPNAFRKQFPSALQQPTHPTPPLPYNATQHFLDIFSFERLAAVDLSEGLESDWTFADWVWISQRISSFPQVASFTVEMELTLDETDDHGDFFRPLYAMNLVEFSYTSAEDMISLTNSDIADMVHSWPGLVIFKFTIPIWANFLPLLTLTSLEHFAGSCPELHMLSIAIVHDREVPLLDLAPEASFSRTTSNNPTESSGDRKALSDAVLKETTSISPSQLTHLDLGRSKLEFIPNLARHVDRLFPMLQELTDGTTEMDDEDIEMLRVSVLELCQPVRKETERRFRMG